MAPARLAVLLRHICVPDLPAQNSLPCPSGSGADLESLVFNTQPYVLQSSNLVFGSGAMVGAMFRALGGDALIARDASLKGELISVGGNLTVSNPVRRVNQLPTAGATASDEGGVLGIVAARNGYGSSAWSQFARRDGSTPPTADWDFAGRSLTNVNQLGAHSVSVLGSANVEGATTLKNTLNVAGATTFNGETTSHGLLTANNGIQLKEGAWIYGNANITGNVGVLGWMGVKGDLSVTEGGFYANKSVKLPYATENTACDVSHDSVATAAIAEQNALLVCQRNNTSGKDPAGTWKYPRTRMKNPPEVVVVEIDPSRSLCTQRTGYEGQPVIIKQATVLACSDLGIQGGVVNMPSNGLWLPTVTQYRPGMVKDSTHAWNRVAGATEYWIGPHDNTGRAWTVSMLTTGPEKYEPSNAYLQVVFTKIETY